MSHLAQPQTLLRALRDIAAPLTARDTAAQIQLQARSLFPALELEFVAGDVGTSDGCVAVVPLIARTRTIGTLVGRAKALDGLSSAELEALAAFADHCALALDNAALLDERSALASRDALTGLLNHRDFHERLRAAIERRDDGFAVVLLDLDNFKQVNDTRGHAEGDRVLRMAAGAIVSACRTADPCFRVGGDEFAVLLHGTDTEDAHRVADRARRSVRELDPRIGLSFGIASWPGDAATADGLLEAADRRLYEIKRANSHRGGRGPVSAAHLQHERLAVAARLSVQLAPLAEPRAIAQLAVDELHLSFQYYLAVVQRLEGSVLRVMAAAGPLAAEIGFLALTQDVDRGVNGRVARTGMPALIPDTSTDPDYLRRDPRTDPGSELSLPITVDGRVWGVLNLEQVATDAFDADDVLLAETVAAQIGASLHRAELAAEVEGTVAATLATLIDVLEAKDARTAQHAQDVVELTDRVGRQLGLDDAELRDLRYAALLHDIGKIGVPSDILRKPGRLTGDEFEEIKRHSEVGSRLLAPIPFLRSVAPIVRAIHERWDGAGYPDGLAGEHIPLSARIVGTCDALDAMVSDRPYRSGMPRAAAHDELHRCAGTQFDPRIVAAVIAADVLVPQDEHIDRRATARSGASPP